MQEKKRGTGGSPVQGNAFREWGVGGRKSMPHVCSNRDKVSRSFWRGRQSRVLYLYTMKSSVKSANLDRISPGTSLMKIRSSGGPNLVPYGTPLKPIGTEGLGPSVRAKFNWSRNDRAFASLWCGKRSADTLLLVEGFEVLLLSMFSLLLLSRGIWTSSSLKWSLNFFFFH